MMSMANIDALNKANRRVNDESQTISATIAKLVRIFRAIRIKEVIPLTGKLILLSLPEVLKCKQVYNLTQDFTLEYLAVSHLPVPHM